MSKWVEVSVRIDKTYAVEVENEHGVEQAEQAVIDECMGADVVIEHSRIMANEQMAEAVKDWADDILPL